MKILKTFFIVFVLTSLVILGPCSLFVLPIGYNFLSLILSLSIFFTIIVYLTQNAD